MELSAVPHLIEGTESIHLEVGHFLNDRRGEEPPSFLVCVNPTAAAAVSTMELWLQVWELWLAMNIISDYTVPYLTNATNGC